MIPTTSQCILGALKPFQSVRKSFIRREKQFSKKTVIMDQLVNQLKHFVEIIPQKSSSSSPTYKEKQKALKALLAMVTNEEKKIVTQCAMFSLSPWKISFNFSSNQMLNDVDTRVHLVKLDGRKLYKFSKKSEVTGDLVASLCAIACRAVFKNSGLPFYKNDQVRKQEIIDMMATTQKLSQNDKKHGIVHEVYQRTTSNRTRLIQLICSVPNMRTRFGADTDEARQTYQDLFKAYDIVLKDLKRGLKVFELTSSLQKLEDHHKFETNLNSFKVSLNGTALKKFKKKSQKTLSPKTSLQIQLN
jgi:hypothetical protein